MKRRKKRSGKAIVAVFVSFVMAFVIVGCNPKGMIATSVPLGTRVAPSMLLTVASQVNVTESEMASLDTSNIEHGYFMAKYTGEGNVVNRKGRSKEIDLLHYFYCYGCEREYSLEELALKTEQQKALSKFVGQED